MPSGSSYRDLIVWQKSIKLCLEVYALTGLFPVSEIYGLSSQMRRASVSIPSNIAEGSRRSSRRDFQRFIRNAFGSGAELETQVVIAKGLEFGKSLEFDKIEALLEDVMKMLNGLLRSLE